jgi:hypothetical protein
MLEGGRLIFLEEKMPNPCGTVTGDGEESEYPPSSGGDGQDNESDKYEQAGDV